jgi:phosphoglycolate phosphatase
MRYSAVIFDLDGTLIDSGEGIVHAIECAVYECGYARTPSREEIMRHIGFPLGNLVKEKNGFDDDELKRFNVVFETCKKKYAMEAEIYPGMKELLADVGTSSFIGIATNKGKDYTIDLLDHLGISRMCDDIQASDPDGRFKKADLVENCIKASRIDDRSRIVMIGDTKTDESAAEECGIDFIGVTFGFGFKSLSDVTYGLAADSVQSLRDILS